MHVCNACRNEYYKNNKVKLFPKVECPCGKTVYEYYLEKYLKAKYTQVL